MLYRGYTREDLDPFGALQLATNLLEQFSKITRAKEKDRTSVKFQRKTTHSHNFNARLLTAKLDCPDHNS